MKDKTPNSNTTGSPSTGSGGTKKKVLELESVSAGYNHRNVLEDINLSIYEQDFLGIIGPNGSGKTTLIKLILGLLKPRSGHIHYYYKPGMNSSDTGRAKRPIGYLPQQTLFDKKFPITVKDVVLSGLASKMGVFHSFSRIEKQIADDIMEQMGVVDLKNRAIGSLSGGQMQRVFLARALVASPPLLVLDEPDTFVDQAFSRNFYDILHDLNKSIAIILVSHDLGMISSHVKTIACVNCRIYYHDSNIITKQLLDGYNCPIDLITHGDLPHRVLDKHDHHDHHGDHRHA